jgi:hypothetical protein
MFLFLGAYNSRGDTTERECSLRYPDRWHPVSYWRSTYIRTEAEQMNVAHWLYRHKPTKRLSQSRFFEVLHDGGAVHIFPDDRPLRMASTWKHCGWPLSHNILWTDEACFTFESNDHLWVWDNSHAVRLRVSVSAEIVRIIIMGPYMLCERLTVQLHREFLETVLPDCLKAFL